MRLGRAREIRTADPQQTPTPSLRRRVTLTVLGLFALLLLLVGVAVDVALDAQLRRDLDARLADLADRSTLLAADNVAPQELVDTLDGAGIRVRVITADGTVYGDPGLVTPPDQPGGCPTPPPLPEGCPPPVPGCPVPPEGSAPPPPGCPPPPPRADDSAPTTVITRNLPDGSVVTLLADTAQINDVHRELRGVMLAAAALTLMLAAAVLYGSVGRALRPLDAMTSVARQITAGDRGRRLRPDRRDSELGRAADAFDGMLDALETAEAREHAAAEHARLAEADTRRFLSDAAHELRTPVAGIQNIAETLDRDGNRPRQRTRFTELLLREAGQASRLVSDMLEAARIDADPRLNLQLVDLVDLVDAEVERARLLAPSLTLARTGAATAPVHVDSGRVTQILANLLNNARRHTPIDGRITVTVATTDGHAELTVTDTGPGVPDADRERIFTRLVRLQDARDRDTGGSGLGLTIARGLARAHSGDLTCEPATSGAQFRLTLPCAPATTTGMITP